ncbi:aminoglycoside phosphotransferase family protein [Streptomyces physcomitrii]|uniref:aminoglycoside phosphotransferase family protein n=1 Tax=Streptomyces physcomitrii TaxID=2724184 RepID=UPI00342E6B37
MAAEAAMVVDRGVYPEARTPWEEEGWRREVFAWAGRELAALGLRVTGPLRVRLRPWSVLVRMPVAGQGAVWFKANPPASAFEAPLAAALARWVPEHVLAPLAVDAERGWSLLPDGGALFRDVLGGGGAGPREWEGALRQYARMQYALAPRAGELAELGVPRARTAELPGVFERLVGGNSALGAEERARLRALRPQVAQWCAELAGAGIADSLDHSDLHEGQFFHQLDAGQLFPPQADRAETGQSEAGRAVAHRPEAGRGEAGRSGVGRFTFFDWGDAAVSHPFCSFLVPARRVRELYGAEALPRLRDAYLEPWTGHGRTPAELRRALSLAGRLGVLGRAVSWGRLFPGASEPAHAAGQAAGAGWLRELLNAEPPV